MLLWTSIPEKQPISKRLNKDNCRIQFNSFVNEENVDLMKKTREVKHYKIREIDARKISQYTQLKGYYIFCKCLLSSGCDLNAIADH